MLLLGYMQAHVCSGIVVATVAYIMPTIGQHLKQR